MKIGLYAALPAARIGAEALTSLGAAAENRGFHSLWVPDQALAFSAPRSHHPYTDDGSLPASAADGFADPFTTLAFLAARTRSLRLGLGVCVLSHRSPIHVASAAANLDRLSGGRLDFGVGLGWQREEFEALGTPFDRRNARTREQLESVKRLWRGELPGNAGAQTAAPGHRLASRPLQSPHPPIHFGGQCARALARVADLADGWLGLGRTPGDSKERIAQLERMLGERGRSRSEVEVTVSPYPGGLGPQPVDELRRYRDAGVDQVLLAVHGTTATSLIAELDELACWTAAARP